MSRDDIFAQCVIIAWRWNYCTVSWSKLHNGIIRGNQREGWGWVVGRGLLSGDYAVPANLIENSRCESRIRASSHAWPKLSSLDDWQPGRKRYALVRVCEDYSRPYTRRRNIDFPFIAPRRHGETREIAPNRKGATFYLSLLLTTKNVNLEYACRRIFCIFGWEDSTRCCLVLNVALYMYDLCKCNLILCYT